MCCLGCWKNPTTKDAYRLSIASIIIEIIAIWFGIASFNSTGSSLCLVYGLENVVDFLSSVVVLWRFFAPAVLDDVLERKLRAREQRASMGISILMVMLGLLILLASIADFERGPEDMDEMGAVFTISFFSFFVFAVLAALKFRYAAKLDSPSLNKDGICSLIGATLSLALVINTLIAVHNESLWWLDPLVAFMAGLVAAFLGCWALYVARTREHVPLCSLRWWRGRDDDKEHGSGTSTGAADSNVEMPSSFEDADIV